MFFCESQANLCEEDIWKSPEKQRQFFIDVAKKLHFDPLNKEAWYGTSAKEVSTQLVYFFLIDDLIDIQIREGCRCYRIIKARTSRH